MEREEKEKRNRKKQEGDGGKRDKRRRRFWSLHSNKAKFVMFMQQVNASAMRKLKNKVV